MRHRVTCTQTYSTVSVDVFTEMSLLLILSLLRREKRI